MSQKSTALGPGVWLVRRANRRYYIRFRDKRQDPDQKWFAGNDTGISSKAMAGVMSGARASDTSTPRDPDDFGRCYRLLRLFPEWYHRLDEIPAAMPNWGPMIAAWPELCRMYETICDAAGRYTPSKNPDMSQAMYERMRALNDEGMLADGWVRTGRSSWRRGSSISVSLSSSDL